MTAPAHNRPAPARPGALRDMLREAPATSARPSASPAALADVLSDAPPAPPPSFADTGRLDVQVTLLSIRYQSETGWVVATCETDQPIPAHLCSSPGRVTVTGTWIDAVPGATYRIQADPEHGKYGWQLTIPKGVSPTLVVPDDALGIERMLASEALKHIGPMRARAIVAAFGTDALRIIAEEPARLAEIKGITAARATQIHEDWQRLRGRADVSRELYSYGLTAWQVGKIYARYGDQALEVLRTAPYSLIEAIDGFGFATVDSIARRSGVKPHDPRRIEAAVLHVLGEELEEGHCACARATLVSLVMRPRKSGGLGLDDAPAELVGRAVDALISRRALVDAPIPDVEKPIAFCSIRETEEALAGRLRDLAAAEYAEVPALEGAAEALTDEQAAALTFSRTRGVLVMTGGPGTGKTYTLRAIVQTLRAAGLTVELAAPTGKAAQRMAEATGEPARTLHRLLEYSRQDGLFARSRDWPLDCDVVVVDEASMVDVQLARALVDAVTPGETRLLLVGDVDQLPSVGPGAVLRDVIASGAVPVVRLTRVMRQAEGSAIVRTAHLVRQGLGLASTALTNPPTGDLHWYGFDDGDAGRDKCRAELFDLVATLRASGWDPVRDVQILGPQKRGRLGTEELGAALREVLNPPGAAKPEVSFKGERGAALSFRLGDKVIQVVNNYKLDGGSGVFNGEVGIVAEVGRAELVVDFGDRRVAYGASDARGLRLAYALTIHKSQGSEWPVVIIPVVKEAHHMWCRQLAYTGLTRARSYCVMLGQDAALNRAIKHDAPARRVTALVGLLRGGQAA